MDKDQRVVLAVAAVAVALVGIAAVSSGGGPDGGDDTSSEVTSTAPDTPQERCVNVVNNLLSQVPKALAEGYPAGVKTDSISTAYGYSSVEFRTVIQAQAQLISQIAQNGHPTDALSAIQPFVKQECASARG